jgi:hypothetical protein
MSDIDGQPGVILESIHLTDLPFHIDTLLTGELVTATSILRPRLQKGSRYWVVASADADSHLVWWISSTGFTSIAVRADGGAWITDENATGVAFRAVPEPNTLLLFVMGGLGCLHRARKVPSAGRGELRHSPEASPLRSP